jgi:protein TonB
METDKILSSNVLDIIFDGKNKMYGAYNLRTTYNVRLSKALLFTASFALVVFIGGVFENGQSSKVPSFDFDDYTILSAKAEPVVPRPQSTEVVKKEVNQKKLNVPVIVIDKLVAKDDALTELTRITSSVHKQYPVTAKGRLIPHWKNFKARYWKPQKLIKTRLSVAQWK